MQTIYESASFFVSQFHGCFEIMDRRTGTEICLANSLANAFSARLYAWKQTPPSTSEIEEVLEEYAIWAHIPVRAH